MRLLFLAALLLPALVLAQPVPNNCTSPSAQCKARKFALLQGNALCLDSTGCATTIKASASSDGFAFVSGVANSGTNAAYNFDTTNALSGSTLLFNLSNQGVSKLTVDNTGFLSAFGGLSTQGNAAAVHFINTNTAVSAYILGLVTDGASAVGTIIDQSGPFATNGAKLVSIQNGESEVASFSFRGTLNQATTDISGTPGSGTINTPSGTAAFPATSSAAITITSAVAKATSTCVATLQTADATCSSPTCVCSAGSLSLKCGAGTSTTGITKVGFTVLNGN